MTTADVGVIGGSGFYEFLEDPAEVTVSTRYGRTEVFATFEPNIQRVKALHDFRTPIPGRVAA